MAAKNIKYKGFSSLAIHAQRACVSASGNAIPVLQIASQNNSISTEQVITIPVVVLFLSLSRWLVSGLTLGSVKE